MSSAYKCHSIPLPSVKACLDKLTVQPTDQSDLRILGLFAYPDAPTTFQVILQLLLSDFLPSFSFDRYSRIQECFMFKVIAQALDLFPSILSWRTHLRHAAFLITGNVLYNDTLNIFTGFIS